MNTPTPETDAFARDAIGLNIREALLQATDFARKLERERDNWKQKENSCQIALALVQYRANETGRERDEARTVNGERVMKHSVLVMVYPEKIFPCPKCGSCYNYLSNLKSHFDIVHRFEYGDGIKIKLLISRTTKSRK